MLFVRRSPLRSSAPSVRRPRSGIRPVAFLLATLLPLAAARADEGMWTLDRLPLAAMKAEYGFAPDAKWTRHVQRSAVRLAGGCSGSFVSPDGLVMTNHHCVRECVQQLSTAERDYTADGFSAKTAKDEVMCPTIELNRLDEISDVTARMNRATAGLSGAEFSRAQKAEQSKIESECVGKDAARTRCDVVKLYDGGLYDLYRYHRFQDARLVFAPEEAIAFFGGDPDNFMFPRYDLDMGLLRAYEDGKPARVADYLPFSKNGAEDGEMTMVVGHPGRTQRQLTMAQLGRVRDADLIPRLVWLAEVRGALNQYASEGAEPDRTSQTYRFSTENTYKVLRGQLAALQDPEVFAARQRAEDELRAFVAQDPKRQADYGAAWDNIARAQLAYRDFELPYKLIERSEGFTSDYFMAARALVRGAVERPKPNAERLREYTDAALPTLTQRLFSQAPIYPELEKVKLALALGKLRERLTPDDPLVKAVLGKDSPATVAARLVDGTKLGDPALRKQLWEGGAAAVDASDDPFLVLARLVDAPARSLRQRFDDEVDAIETDNAARIAKARFERYGTSVYPDATFTLRLSYGRVAGWSYKGQTVAPFTRIAGAFERATGFDPFRLPASWRAAQNQLDGDQRFDFVSTNDIIGGNSGSPVINRKAEVVGLAFDGNIHSLGGNFAYDPRLNRSVAVHSGAMLEAMRKIYGAGRVVDEIEAARRR